MQLKINQAHYDRQAYIYIRQSTMNQVYNHRESQRLQYQLVERAQELGWSQPVVIDDDLGRSGAGTVDRPGFSRILEDVAQGKVGAIFCVEASRLARNNREWYQLIEYCAIVKTLLIDLDGIYDPGNTSDRVFLGMKGTMSEYELSIFRHRAQAAIQEKAQRGEFLTNLPAGFIKSEANLCELDPQRPVQEAFKLIFSKFQELGSANQVVLFFRQNQLEIPCRNARGTVIWKLPSVSTIKKILTNPIYAGAYVYGRTQTRIKIIAGQPRKVTEKQVPMANWKICIKEHHPAYISWDEYLQNQQRLSANINKRGIPMKGAPKKGPALLVGLLRCRRCGQKLNVRYSASNPGVPRYSCRGRRNIGHAENCLSFYGTALEQLISEEVLRVVQPGAIMAAEKAEQVLVEQQQQQVTSLVNLLKRAESEAQRCYEQYNRVDCHHRLVASTLESRWNQALEKVAQRKQQLEALQETCPPLSEPERQLLYQLSANFNRVWQHPQVDVRLKKRLLQILIQEIIVDLVEDNSLTVVIHWMGGVHTEHRIKRRKKAQFPKAQPRDLSQLIRELAVVVADQDLARILNLLKIKNPANQGWDALQINNFRDQHHIPAFDAITYQKKGWVNLKQAAEILETFPETVRRLIKAKIIIAQQVIKYSPWMIDKEQLKKQAVLDAVKKLNQAAITALTKDQLNLNF